MTARGLTRIAVWLLTLLIAALQSVPAQAAMSSGCSAISTAYSGGMTVTKPADTNLFVAYVPFNLGEKITYSVTAISGDMRMWVYGPDGSGFSSTINTVSTATGTIASAGDQVRVQTSGNSGSITFSISCAAASSNADLSSLSVSTGSLSPTFSSGALAYTASVANSVTSLRITPTADESNATIKVNGASVTSGAASNAISLNVGSNTITTEPSQSHGRRNP